MIDKQKIKELIILQLEQALSNAVNAAESAHLAATDDQSVAETQYDTLGIEASYLAQGQSERIENIKQQILKYQQLLINDFAADDEIQLSCLLLLGSAENAKYYFIGPCSGGLKVSINGEDILVITPHAPIAQSLIGKYQFDQIPSMGNNSKVVLEILAVY
ncbi:hypothetical protein AADZ86_07570 [Colwelliaceae bacterium BS250]